MIKIQAYENTSEFPKELQGYQSIEVLECDSKTKKHGLIYYCILDGVLETVEYGGRNIDCLARLYRRNPSIDTLLTVYESEGAKVDNFAPYANSKYLIRKLFGSMEGKSFEEALSYVGEHIRRFQGAKRDEEYGRILHTEYGIIVGSSTPLIRRYSDNPKKNTFDIVEIIVKVSLHSQEELKKWYSLNDNRKNLVKYALEKIGESR